MQTKLTRIGVFYDGSYFHHISNYYAFSHPRKARIDVAGLHNYIKRQVAKCEDTDERYCQIVDAHYFRGRFRAQDAEQRELLLKERMFDDILSRVGVTNHHLPVGPYGEKGIDVWLALEAYEMATYKKFDVIVLIAGDGDFLPLVKKLNTLGTRVMVLAWDFKYIDKNNNERETKTSQLLIEESTYPVLMHQVIDDRSLHRDPIVNGLFFAPKPRDYYRDNIDLQNFERMSDRADIEKVGERKRGKVMSLKDGYGFVMPDDGGPSVFFFHTELTNMEFGEVEVGDNVEYQPALNDKGPCALDVRIELEPDTDSRNMDSDYYSDDMPDDAHLSRDIERDYD